MTPEVRLALRSVLLSVTGLALIAYAVVTAGHEHKGEQ